METQTCKMRGVEVSLFTSTPCSLPGLGAFKLLDAFFYSCEFLLQLLFIFFQSFLLLFRGYESSGKHAASTSTTAAATSPNPQCTLASCWSTHFLSPPLHKEFPQMLRVTTAQTNSLIKNLSYYLINYIKKFTYFLCALISEILSRTFCSSLFSSLSYFIRDAKFALFSSCSLKLPAPLHPHVQTSFNTAPRAVP